jgi:hypothetical protein
MAFSAVIIAFIDHPGGGEDAADSHCVMESA